MGYVFIVAPAFAGALFLYLSSSNQCWLRVPWPARPARAAAAMSLAFSLGYACLAMHPATSLFIVVTVLMTSLTALPFAGVLIDRSRTRRSTS